MTQQKILVSHCGSLPRPKALLDAMKAKLQAKQPLTGDAAYDTLLAGAVADTVAEQVACGIDIVSDGEFSKPGFFSYVKQRLTGFEERPEAKRVMFPAEVNAFPEYYADYFARAMTGGAVAPVVPVVCVAPVRYQGQAAIAADLKHLTDAIAAQRKAGKEVTGAFVPACAPSGAGDNEYYKTEEEYFEAVGEAMREEYLAIVDAGFQVQVDDPFLCDIFVDPALDETQKQRRAGLYVEAINHAVRGIAAEKIRFHTCYGINEGPRIHEAALAQVAGHMLKVNAGAYSFEAANARHEHEYHLWETTKLPAGKKLIPGVITHASNIVEHPELIKERLGRFAKLVGAENVIAGTDCGFSSQASYKTEVHPTVVREKFKAMAEGAGL